MAGEEQSNEKTEEPTQRRIQDAVKKGQVAFSREVTSFLMLVVLALNIIWFAPAFMRDAALSLSHFLHSPHDIDINVGSLKSLAADTLADIGILMMLPILATVIAAILSSFIQNGLVISAESIIPKFEKISPMRGLKRLFSLKSFMEFAKGLIKIALVGSIGYASIAPSLHQLTDLVVLDLWGILALLTSFATRMVIGACAVMFVIAVLDYLYQKYEYIKGLKMTKQEIKEEYKQSEGDPQIKAKLKQIRMERARHRMMAEVPTADVVITNPTHFAIALKYDEDTMTAPIVVAKGQDNIAFIIRETAEKHDVPIVENPPLARALFDNADLDEEIPLEHYQAVAEIIGYVYRLRGKIKDAA